MERRVVWIVVLALGCGRGTKQGEADAAAPDDAANATDLAPTVDASVDVQERDARDAAPEMSGIDRPTAGAVTFCQRLIDALVDWRLGCAPGLRSALTQRYDRDLLCRRIGASVGAGRLVFDESRVEACLSWLHAYPCNSVTAPLHWKGGPCLDVLAGQVQADGSCYPVMIRGPFGSLDSDSCDQNFTCDGLDFGSVPDECASGSHCDYAETCPGICRWDVPEGQSCGPVLPQNPRPRCAPGAFCDSAAGDLCRRPSGRGEPCGPVLPCQDGLACDHGILEEGTCQPLRAAGPCSNGSQCQGRCISRPFDPAGPTCMPIAGLGEACVGAGVQDVCGAGLICDGHACVALPGPGQACIISCSLGACFVGAPSPTFCSTPTPLGGRCDPLLPNCGPRAICAFGPGGVLCRETCRLP
jgi:hypothetical protein